MLLIISGGLGFSVWEDIKTNHFHMKKYRLQSKAVLLVTLVLIIAPALYFYIFEFSGWDMTGSERVLASLFQSVTPRTAGFNTVDLTAVNGSSLTLITVLMLIGGSTGSTAGGMKTTTLAVLISSALGVFRSKKDTRMFGRRIENETVVTIGENFQNSLETTALLQELGAQKVISRASSDFHAKFLLKNGADEVVYPEEQLASWTAIRYTSDNVFDYIALDGDYAIYELSVPKIWVGKTVGEINIRRKYAINILAIRKDDGLCPDISTETLLGEKDILLVLGSNASVRKCFHI